MNPFRSLTACIGIAVLSTALGSSAAQASINLTQRGCQSYASWSGNIVWARDLGADKEKTRVELTGLDQKTPASIYALMLRNLESLWTTNANWEQVTLLILQDCINRRGQDRGRNIGAALDPRSALGLVRSNESSNRRWNASFAGTPPSAPAHRKGVVLTKRRRRHTPLRRGLVNRRDLQQNVFLAGLGAEHEREG